MLPTLFEVDSVAGPIQVHPYGMFIMLAFCVAFIIVGLRATQAGISIARLGPVFVASAVGGIIGGHLLFLFAVAGPAAVLAKPSMLFLPTGFAVYGGVLFGTLSVWAAALAMGVPTWQLADIGGPAAVLAMGVGRLGCFTAGCCHGAPVTLSERAVGLLPSTFAGGQIWAEPSFPFLALEFHGGVSRYLDMPLYPTQLWSAAALIGLGAALVSAWPRRQFDGQLAGLAMLLEPPVRIFVESFRADHRGVWLAIPVPDWVLAWLPGLAQAGEKLGEGAKIGLTTSQVIGLLTMMAGLALLIWRRGAGVSRELVDDLEVDPALAD